MSTISILNDVLGPVMRGPSSSHTAGAYRIGRVAAMLADGAPASVRVGFDPGGSYAPTYHAMGVDAALAAALLGWEMTDERYPQAPAAAASAGLDLTFVVGPLDFHDHPNTIRLEVTARLQERGTGILSPRDVPPVVQGRDGPATHSAGRCAGREAHATTQAATHVLWARSIGGGMIDVFRFDDWPCSIDAKAWSVLVQARAGAAQRVGRLMADLLGLAAPACRHEQAGAVLTQWNSPRAVGADVLGRIRAGDGVLDVRLAQPLMHVPRGAALFDSGQEMLARCAQRNWSLGQAGREYEAALLDLSPAEVTAEMLRRYAIMEAAAERGLDDSRLSLPLLKPSAGSLWRAEQAGTLVCGGMMARATARGLAVLHVSNSQGVVCAAPTGGSCGVLPGVVITLAQERKLDREAIARALLAAGAVGLIIARRATFAAEEAGCQVEIGAAGAMAAAAVVESAGGTAAQAADAASIALQNTIGMVCDPVDGGCEIPCHTRTAGAIAQAFICADLVLGGYVNPISLDDAVDASCAVGRQLPASLRCTAQGGIAATPSAQRLVARRRK